MKSNRELAIEWWSKIPLIEREIFWDKQKTVDTHGRLAKYATGRELELLWNEYLNTDIKSW